MTDKLPSNSDNQPKKSKQIKLTMTPEVAKGSYSNLLISNFSKEEFILDFGLIHPQGLNAAISSRIILSPTNAKKIAGILAQQVKDYEQKHGSISDDQSASGPIKFSFN